MIDVIYAASVALNSSVLSSVENLCPSLTLVVT